MQLPFIPVLGDGDSFSLLFRGWLGVVPIRDMKSGLALMLAALKSVEASPLAARIGYEVVINSEEETGSFSSASPLIRRRSPI